MFIIEVVDKGGVELDRNISRGVSNILPHHFNYDLIIIKFNLQISDIC